MGRSLSSAERQLTADATDDKCLLREPRIIRDLLQRLVDGHCALVATADAGMPGVTLPPLAIEGDTLWLGVPRNRGLLQRLLGAGHVSLQGLLDGALLRFGSEAVSGTRAGAPALGIPLPARLLHVQRRRDARREPQCDPLVCRIHSRDRAGRDAPLRTTIRDIGGGGLALITSETPLPFVCGDVLSRCAIELPEAETLEVAMRVRHVRLLRQHGRLLHQFGCEFVGLDAAAQARLSSI
ncbi:flagellar brake protein [Luteimonas sp. SJ-92]|uniref:Flagellar brake protein n=1 Tax=Luteimonas salinisoli TaxID=2752307 RepID=A0A853JEU7_9GAMM|nr:flagellar brake protein [Luteimonas salinisoli]NZA27129.1 flagellar brake protein [Luteimonas salinisoli]